MSSILLLPTDVVFNHIIIYLEYIETIRFLSTCRQLWSYRNEQAIEAKKESVLTYINTPNFDIYPLAKKMMKLKYHKHINYIIRRREKKVGYQHTHKIVKCATRFFNHYIISYTIQNHWLPSSILSGFIEARNWKWGTLFLKGYWSGITSNIKNAFFLELASEGNLKVILEMEREPFLGVSEFLSYDAMFLRAQSNFKNDVAIFCINRVAQLIPSRYSTHLFQELFSECGRNGNTTIIHYIIDNHLSLLNRRSMEKCLLCANTTDKRSVYCALKKFICGWFYLENFIYDKETLKEYKTGFSVLCLVSLLENSLFFKGYNVKEFLIIEIGILPTQRCFYIASRHPSYDSTFLFEALKRGNVPNAFREDACRTFINAAARTNNKNLLKIALDYASEWNILNRGCIVLCIEEALHEIQGDGRDELIACLDEYPKYRMSNERPHKRQRKS
jgi:hypothetical protein